MEPDSPSIVGAPPHLPTNKIDPGFVFLFVCSNNPLWWPVIFQSVSKQFEKAILYFGNGSRPNHARFHEVPVERRDLLESLNAMVGKAHKASLPVSQDYGSRFLAKLGLGFGGLFLKPAFRQSASAKLLREFLWTPNLQKRQEIPVLGSNFFMPIDAHLTALLHWAGGHLLLMLPFANRLILYASFFEKQTATILISSDPVDWEGSVQNDGTLYVISPGLRRAVGPIALSQFFLHRTGTLEPELASLAAEECQYPLPPFHI